jgi:hypothetical protein
VPTSDKAPTRRRATPGPRVARPPHKREGVHRNLSPPAAVVGAIRRSSPEVLLLAAAALVVLLLLPGLVAPLIRPRSK